MRIKSLVKIVAIASVLALAGCASVSQNYQFQPTKPQGIVALSLACNVAGGNGSFQISPMNTTTGKTIAFDLEGFFTGSQMTFDCSSQDNMNPKHQILLAKLNPGDYAIDSWSITSGPMTWSPVKSKPIFFSVVNHKVTYIGNIRLAAGFGQSFETVLSAKYTQYDLDLIKQRLPRISPNQFITRYARF